MVSLLSKILAADYQALHSPGGVLADFWQDRRR